MGTQHLSPEARREVASRAARARWARRLYPAVVLGKRGVPVSRHRAYQLRIEADGRCVACGKPREDERTMCSGCRDKDNARRRARREARRSA